jgi:hypothetical protein
MPHTTRRRAHVRRRTLRKKGGFTPLKLARYREIIQNIPSRAARDNLYDDVMASLLRDNRVNEAIQFYQELMRYNGIEHVISYPFKNGERTHLPFFKNFMTFAKTITEPFLFRIRKCTLTEDAATLLSNFIASEQCIVRRFYAIDVKMNKEAMTILANGIRNNRSMIELRVELSNDQDEQESSQCMYALSQALIGQTTIKQVHASCSKSDFKGWGEVISNNSTIVALTIEDQSEAMSDNTLVNELADGLHKNTTLTTFSIRGPKFEKEQIKQIFIGILTNKESGLYSIRFSYTRNGNTYGIYPKEELEMAKKELQNIERVKTVKLLNGLHGLPTNISKMIANYSTTNIPTKLYL